jgi:hypothetical protein
MIRHPRPFPLALLVTLGAVLLAACTAATGAAGRIPRLPVLGAARDAYDGDIGDPYVIAQPGLPEAPQRYVLFGTDDPPDHLPTATSPDLVAWTHGPDAVPVEPAWANPDPDDRYTWAPAAVGIAGHYVLYASVQATALHRECIAAFASTTALGPYDDAVGHPLVCQPSLGGSIDPSIVRDHGLHLVWKNDGNCCGIPVSLWEQNLTASGLAVTGAPHRLLTADEAWQGGVIENPALLRATQGGWWLFYSGNNFELEAYGTGLAWCPSLTGPCRETSTRPFLASAGRQYSPGGLDFFTDAGGRRWAAFATWDRPPRHGRFYCCRSVQLSRVLSS